MFPFWSLTMQQIKQATAITIMANNNNINIKKFLTWCCEWEGEEVKINKRNVGIGVKKKVS